MFHPAVSDEPPHTFLADSGRSVDGRGSPAAVGRGVATGIVAPL
jgi:hypothetical protein